jgi:hypothetical protein
MTNHKKGKPYIPALKCRGFTARSWRAYGSRNLMKVVSVTALFSAPRSRLSSQFGNYRDRKAEGGPYRFPTLEAFSALYRRGAPDDQLLRRGRRNQRRHFANHGQHQPLIAIGKRGAETLDLREEADFVL